MGIIEKQAIEIKFWKNSIQERPEANSADNIINKVSDAAIFLDCVKKYLDKILKEGKVLELGGGQGWAACLLKRLYPKASITLTDISKYAIASLYKWEKIWDVKLDNKYACKSYKTKEIDGSIDIIFCFAAAHHFLAHRRTIMEISRILKPGGKAYYFYEPTSPNFFYWIAYKRVNNKRPHVPEDVLIPSKIVQLAKESNLNLKVDYYPSLINRGPKETLYYYFLNNFNFLQKLLPCTANFTFIKPL